MRQGIKSTSAPGWFLPPSQPEHQKVAGKFLHCCTCRPDPAFAVRTSQVLESQDSLGGKQRSAGSSGHHLSANVSHWAVKQEEGRGVQEPDVLSYRKHFSREDMAEQRQVATAEAEGGRGDHHHSSLPASILCYGLAHSQWHSPPTAIHVSVLSTKSHHLSSTTLLRIYSQSNCPV